MIEVQLYQPHFLPLGELLYLGHLLLPVTWVAFLSVVLQIMQHGSFVQFLAIWPPSPHLLHSLDLSLPLQSFARCPYSKHLKQDLGFVASLTLQMVQPILTLPADRTLFASSNGKLMTAVWVPPYAVRRLLIADSDKLSVCSCFFSASSTSSLVVSSSRSLHTTYISWVRTVTLAFSPRAVVTASRSTSLFAPSSFASSNIICPPWDLFTRMTFSPISFREGSLFTIRRMSAYVVVSLVFSTAIASARVCVCVFFFFFFFF